MSLFAKKEIYRVKYMGVRTAEQTKVLGTYNSSMYCFLVEYTDGSRALLDYEAKDKALQEILPFIDMD
nr:MAG TPA: hypothetical protein [Caudoviricetes sp.]